MEKRSFVPREKRKRFIRSKTTKDYCPGGCGAVLQEEGLCHRCEQALMRYDEIAELEKNAATRVHIAERDITHNTWLSVLGFDDSRDIWYAVRDIVGNRVPYDQFLYGDPAKADAVTTPGGRTPDSQESIHRVVATPKQREGLIRFFTMLGGALDKIYLEGYRRGRSLIDNLGNGEITPAKYGEQEILLAQATQSAARRAAGEYVAAPEKRRLV